MHYNESTVISIDATRWRQTLNVPNYRWKFRCILGHFISHSLLHPTSFCNPSMERSFGTDLMFKIWRVQVIGRDSYWWKQQSDTVTEWRSHSRTHSYVERWGRLTFSFVSCEWEHNTERVSQTVSQRLKTSHVCWQTCATWNTRSICLINTLTQTHRKWSQTIS